MQKALETTADTWLSNPYFEDGLYLFTAVWNAPDYAGFLQRLRTPVNIGRLERIAGGLRPQADLAIGEVDEVTRLRAHMLLFKLVPDPQKHADFVRQFAAGGTPEEQEYLLGWIEA